MDGSASVGALSLYGRQAVPRLSISRDEGCCALPQPDDGAQPEQHQLDDMSESVAREPPSAPRHDGSRRDDGQRTHLRPLQPRHRGFKNPRHEGRQGIHRQSAKQDKRFAAAADRPLGTAAGMERRLGQPQRHTPPRVASLRPVSKQPDITLPHSRTDRRRTHIAHTPRRPVYRMEHGMESMSVVASARRQPRTEAHRRPADARAQREEEGRHIRQPLRCTPAIPD